MVGPWMTLPLISNGELRILKFSPVVGGFSGSKPFSKHFLVVIEERVLRERFSIFYHHTGVFNEPFNKVVSVRWLVCQLHRDDSISIEEGVSRSMAGGQLALIAMATVCALCIVSS